MKGFGNMCKKIKKCFDKELMVKLFCDILIVILFSAGSLIPLYGINRTQFDTWLNSDVLNNVNIFGLLSGNSFKSMSIFALGIAPYITASIIVQLLTVIIPKLDELRKQSQEKIEKYTYLLAGVFTVIQSVLTTIYFYNNGLLQKPNIFYFSIVAAGLCIGAVVVILMAKFLDKHGIGKGISIILLTNIVSQLPSSMQSLYQTFVPQQINGVLFGVITFVVISFLIIAVICLQDAEKRIPIQQAGQTRAMHKLNYLPIKLNLSNVMPVIFTSSIFQFIILISNFVKNDTFTYVAQFFNMGNWFSITNPIYSLGLIPYVILIVAFAYFYVAFSFDAEDVADGLKKKNIVIVGIRPGQLTVDYLKRELKWFVFLGAILLTIIVTLPIAIIQFLNVTNFALVGTSLLIMNSVSVELFKEIETEIITKREVDFFS